jgi:hypothetical protein
MTAFYSIEAGAIASPHRPLDGGAIKQLSVIRRTFTMAAQTTSDTLEGIKLPKGFRPVRWGLVPSATLGSSTLALGIAGTTGKYRAAATVTAPVSGDVVTAPPAAGLAADEDVIVTIAAATLPGSGTIAVEFWGTYE